MGARGCGPTQPLDRWPNGGWCGCMITSRYPVLRTNPAGFAVSGYWPILTGSLTVLVFIPVIALIISTIATALFASDPHDPAWISSISLLIASPIVSWAPLIVAIFVSGKLAIAGFAGWGVAAIGGFLGGFISHIVLNVGSAVGVESWVLASVGTGFGLVFWLAIRIMHPTAIGIPFHAPPSG